MMPISLNDTQWGTVVGVIFLFVTIIGIYLTIIKREFSIFMNSSAGVIVLGGVIPVRITIKSTRYRHPITLHANMPSGVVVTFSPEVVTPSRNRYIFYKATCESTMTIAANDAITGTRYPISIIGTGNDGSERRNVFTLICLNPEEPVSI